MRILFNGNVEAVGSGVGEPTTDCSGEMEPGADSSCTGEGVGVGDSCAVAIVAKATPHRKTRMFKSRCASRDLSIVAPVQVRKDIVPPLAVAQEFFVHIVCDKLIVQTIEPSKVLGRSSSCVFPGGPIFD